MPRFSLVGAHHRPRCQFWIGVCITKITNDGIGKLGGAVTGVTSPMLTLRTVSHISRCPTPHETPTMIEAIRKVARARPLGMLAALLLCTALTACGGDSDNPPASGGGTPADVKPQMKCAP